MTTFMEQLAAASGHRELQSALRDRQHPLCTLLHCDRHDLDPTLVEDQAAEEKRRQARLDAGLFQLQAQFIRAHGLPRGEVTTLAPGGVFSSRLDRPR